MNIYYMLAYVFLVIFLFAFAVILVKRALEKKIKLAGTSIFFAFIDAIIACAVVVFFAAYYVTGNYREVIAFFTKN